MSKKTETFFVNNTNLTLNLQRAQEMIELAYNADGKDILYERNCIVGALSILIQEIMVLKKFN